MSRKKKAQGLSMNVIIIAVIALIVLVVIVAMIAGRLGSFSKGTDDVLASETKGFDWGDDGMSDRTQRVSQGVVSGIATDGVAEDEGAATGVESDEAETIKEVTTETAPAQATTPDCDNDEDMCLDKEECPDKTSGDEGKGFGEQLFVGAKTFGTPKCSGDDEGEWYLANRYADDGEAGDTPGSKHASCERPTDCVMTSDPPFCFQEGHSSGGWACSNNLWDLCDSDDKCDTLEIGGVPYYCDGIYTWTTIKPEGCDEALGKEGDDGRPGPGESCGEHKTSPWRCENEQTCPNGFFCDVKAGCLCLRK